MVSQQMLQSFRKAEEQAAWLQAPAGGSRGNWLGGGVGCHRVGVPPDNSGSNLGLRKFALAW